MGFITFNLKFPVIMLVVMLASSFKGLPPNFIVKKEAAAIELVIV